MSITRTGDIPIFLKFITEQALIPRNGTPSTAFIQLTQFNFRWIDIPSYQRGLVWDEEDFEQLLNSPSVFLGNAILGHFPVPTPRDQFGMLPDNVQHYEVLVDGLQRFSIGTALLHILHQFIFAQGARFPNEAQHYAALGLLAVPMALVYEHNDNELANHHRKAVRESYVEFRQTLASWLENEITQGRGQALAQRILHLLLRRQIAPDIYHGFQSEYDVTSTFIGLNTVRVQLSVVDWLRSVIVDRGAASQWTSPILADIDNRFTEVFIKGTNPVSELMPFASIILNCLTQPTATAPQFADSVFPSWNASLDVREVQRFLAFVEEMVGETKKNSCNRYFFEITRCGKIPLAGCLCYFYRQYLANGNNPPSFITGGNLEDGELKTYLRANYRALLAGCIGRTREYAERLLREPVSLMDISDEISNFAVGRGLAGQVDPAWLRTALGGTDGSRAQRMFNACLMTLSTVSGGAFDPLGYGTRGNAYQVDHMIPESVIMANQPGEAEARSMPNFAPIRRSANNAASCLTCSAKLAAGGSYANECVSDPMVHPYVAWLVAHQAHYGAFLDDQARLQPNSTPNITGERIGWLVDRLLPRL